jgi:hypothetical protein
MWRLALVLCACGGAGSGDKAMAVSPQDTAQPITVEWKVEQADGDQVSVALVVDGRSVPIGVLDAATESEAGTPNTCAMRAASPRRTELVCGDANAYAAELVETDLVISLVRGDGRSEVKRVPVYGNVLSVKMLSLPFDEPPS